MRVFSRQTLIKKNTIHEKRAARKSVGLRGLLSLVIFGASACDPGMGQALRGCASRKLARAQAEGPKMHILAFGDSLTEGTSSKCRFSFRRVR